ncbi:MAG: TRAP transporter small permease [Thermodesulfobacteriota bacterium]
MEKIYRRWNEIEKIIFGLLAFLAVVIAFYGVIMRYIFKTAPDWSDEMVVYAIIWAVFLSASTLAEEKGHVAATLLVERFSLSVRRYLAIFNSFLALGFCLLVANYGYRIVSTAYLRDERSLTILRFPLWIPYLAVAMGCTLIAIRYIKRIYLLIFRFELAQILETHELSREEKHQ